MRLLQIFILGFFMFSSFAQAQEKTPTPTIQIEEAYAFATAPGSVTGAGFMVLKNTSNVADSLIKAESSVAEINEIHENIIDPDDGKMMMRKIKSITVPANGTVALEPKGMHIMLIKLKEPLTLGESFPLTLTFEKAGVQNVDVKIIQPGGVPEGTVKIAPDEMHDHEGHHHGHIHGKLITEEKPIAESTDNFPTTGFEKPEDSKEDIHHF